MEKVQYLLTYHGTVTVNHEYTVTLSPGQALQIDWFPDNDLLVSTDRQTHHFNAANTTLLPDGRRLIEIITTQNLRDQPVRLERGDYLVAGDVVINQKTRQYFTASAIDILPDELVAAHGNRVTRVLFSGDKSAVEQYVKRSD